jgi:hypothetical protein
MPRGKRGGARQGEMGKAYSNRTDLNENRQPVQVASGLPYGERQALEAAQRTVPLPDAPSVAPASAPVSPRPQGPMPGSFGAFDRMTELPDEPFTAGMNVGPGAGREALVRGVQYTQDDELVAQLRGLYAAFPTTDVARLLQAAEAQANQRGM